MNILLAHGIKSKLISPNSNDAQTTVNKVDSGELEDVYLFTDDWSLRCFGGSQDVDTFSSENLVLAHRCWIPATCAKFLQFFGEFQILL